MFMVFIFVCASFTGGPVIKSALLSNIAQLREAKLRFQSDVKPKSTPADAKRIWERVAGATGIDQPAHWRAVGEMALLDRDWIAAKRAFAQGIALSTDPYDLYLALARAQIGMEDWDGAILSYEKVVTLYPKRDVQPYLQAAEVEIQRGNYAGFANWCYRARRAFPESRVIDKTQGIVAWQLGKWEEAERLLLSAYEKGPSDPYPLYYLALTKQAQGELLAAARYMERAIMVYSYGIPPCDWIGIAGDLYRQAHAFNKARSMYQQGLAYCPEQKSFADRLYSIESEP